MAYQALYRKWRPGTFDDVVGQDAVMTTLKNQVLAGRVGHAYLFCGTRGTGKTSAAKILSRAVNCPNAVKNGGNPCNTCEICKAIKSGSAMSVFEIDAASNNGVDNIRDIRDEVEYPPVTGTYKVYIIDEVHMLSQGAFNALLKTLEEPPTYVIFILATTDPQRVPATILSRCQRYDFRRISPGRIEKHLTNILEKEGLKAEPKAISYISEAADGSMRDALSILDQCMSFHYEEGLRYKDVLDVLGTLDTALYSKLLRQILNSDTEAALCTLDEALGSGADVMQILNDFIWHLRNVLIAGSIEDPKADMLDMSREKMELALEDYSLTDKRTLIYMLGSLAELTNRSRYSPQKRVLLEVELIRLSTGDVLKNNAVLAEPLSDIKGNVGISRGGILTKDNTTLSKKDILKEDSIKSNKAIKFDEIIKPDEAIKPDEDTKLSPAIDVLKENWQQMTRKLHPSNRSLFNQVVLKEENGSIVMLFKNSMNFRLAAGNKVENGVLRLRELAKELTGQDVKLLARIANTRESIAHKDLVTDEELAKIDFPVNIEN